MNGKTTVLVIVLVILGIAGGYYLGTNYKIELKPQGAVSTTAPIPTASPTPELQVLPSVQQTQTVDETATIVTAVRAALIAEHGPDAGTLNITVSKISGDFAQGGASASGGGGMWFAAKVKGAWRLVWDGNGTISCTSVNPYNFPVSMIPECWDDAMKKNVTR